MPETSPPQMWNQPNPYASASLNSRRTVVQPVFSLIKISMLPMIENRQIPHFLIGRPQPYGTSSGRPCIQAGLAIPHQRIRLSHISKSPPPSSQTTSSVNPRRTEFLGILPRVPLRLQRIFAAKGDPHRGLRRPNGCLSSGDGRCAEAD